MRLVQRLWDAYVRRMRRAVPKVGRPCSICGHAKRGPIEAAVTAGTSPRSISKSYRVSRSAIQRHRDHHMRVASPPIPRRDPSPPPGRTPAYDASGNILIDGCGRVTYADGPGGSSPSGGQSTATTPGGSVGGALLYPIRWWGPDTPRPGMGVRCEVCRCNEWWDVANWWGGCSNCWNPEITDGRKRTFRT
jgi:hypothetical protein